MQKIVDRITRIAANIAIIGTVITAVGSAFKAFDEAMQKNKPLPAEKITPEQDKPLN